MDKNDKKALVLVGIILGWFLALTMVTIRGDLRSATLQEAKIAGAGHYYLDTNDERQWKWTGILQIKE